MVGISSEKMKSFDFFLVYCTIVVFGWEIVDSATSNSSRTELNTHVTLHRNLRFKLSFLILFNENGQANYHQLVGDRVSSFFKVFLAVRKKKKCFVGFVHWKDWKFRQDFCFVSPRSPPLVNWNSFPIFCVILEILTEEKKEDWSALDCCACCCTVQRWSQRSAVGF